MAKASKTGNVAVAGIVSEDQKEPVNSLKEVKNENTTAVVNSTGTGKSSASKGSGSSSSGSAKSSGSSTAKATGSGGTGGSAGTVEQPETPYDQKFYAALAAGIPASTNVGELQDVKKAAGATRDVVAGAKANLTPGNVSPVDLVDISHQRAELKAREENEKAKAAQAVDYAVSKGVNDLTRNLQDSKALYQVQRNQVDADEARALDNQVLYAEARGDRGGIGKAQYGAIQNTAANNRMSVNAAETKLQTDTARQIADLRAQGEFEKADKVLEISNKYLTELQNLEKWAKQQNVGVQEFNTKMQEWMNEYAFDIGKYLTDTELKASELFGVSADGTTTADYRNAVNDRYASAGKAMVNAGIVPSASQLESMGWTPEQYWIYKMSNGM